jgi:hypothetical protein
MLQVDIDASFGDTNIEARVYSTCLLADERGIDNGA